MSAPLWPARLHDLRRDSAELMIEDPDGYKVEFSAELEVVPQDMAFRTWPHEERTLNLWGAAWMRS